MSNCTPHGALAPTAATHLNEGRAAILGSPNKPAPIVIDAANIPQELKELDRWLGWVWRWDPDANGGHGKWTKPPVNCRGGAGSSTDESTWCDFAIAIAAAEAGEVDGIGIALGDLGDGRTLSGVDFDDCRDPLTKELAPDVEVLVMRLNSYTEDSPTLTGVKTLCFGPLPPGRRSRGRYECYSDGRYFTITGLKLPASPSCVRIATAELAEFHHAFIDPPAVNAPLLNNDLELPAAALAIHALTGLDPSRADHYGDWLLVGKRIRPRWMNLATSRPVGGGPVSVGWRIGG